VPGSGGRGGAAKSGAAAADLISGWVNLALLERDRRRPEAAEANLRRAFALNPNQVETLVAWSQFRATERDVAGAREWMRWALERNPELDEAVNMHGIVLHLEGQFEEAIEVFERAEALGIARRRRTAGTRCWTWNEWRRR